MVDELRSGVRVDIGQLRSRERREIRTCLPRYLERRARLHWPAFFRQHAFNNHRRLRHLQCRPVEHREPTFTRPYPPPLSSARPTETYEGEPGALLILLSDPSWATFGGPAPYSAGFFTISFRGGGGQFCLRCLNGRVPGGRSFADHVLRLPVQFQFHWTGAADRFAERGPVGAVQQQPLRRDGGHLPCSRTFNLGNDGIRARGARHGRSSARVAKSVARDDCPRSARRLRSDQVGSETGGLGNLTLARICSAWTVARAAGKKPSTIRCASPCTRPQAAMAA